MDVVNLTIAFAALALSAAVAWSTFTQRRRTERSAHVTAYFHHLGYHAEVAVDGTPIGKAGYHLVIWNQGPAVARDIGLRIYDRSGHQLALLACPDDEFPLSAIDVAGRYPIPWISTQDRNPRERQYRVTLTWTDGNGTQHKDLPLRRGKTHT